MKIIRILIVDDHPLMRRALIAAIETEPDMEVVGTAVNGIQGREVFLELQPDLVLMDLLMPDGSGLDAIATIHAEHPDARMLVVTSVEDDVEIMGAFQVGAQGYITKAANTDELLAAIRSISEGHIYLPPMIAARLMTSVRDLASEEADFPNEQLTSREKEVIELVGQGLSNILIAEALHISSSTVNVHLHNIMNKLGLENRRKLVLYAVQHREI